MTGISLDPSLVRPDGRPGLLGTLSGVPHSTSLLSGGGLTAVDTVLVSLVADPVDLGVGLDDGVRGVDEDDLVPLLLSVGSDPVGVQDLEVGVPLGGPLLGRDLPTVIWLIPFLLALLPVTMALFWKDPFLTLALTTT